MCIKPFNSNFQIFFSLQYTYRVRGAIVGENLMPLGEYSSTVKNRRKCVMVYSVVIKGLKAVGQPLGTAKRV